MPVAGNVTELGQLAGSSPSSVRCGAPSFALENVKLLITTRQAMVKAVQGFARTIPALRCVLQMCGADQPPMMLRHTSTMAAYKKADPAGNGQYQVHMLGAFCHVLDSQIRNPETLRP